MSNPVPTVDPAEFLAGISDMTIEQQIKLVKEHVRLLRGAQALNFVKHPAMVAWITHNTKAINASVVIPKSHGGPGR